MFVYRRYAVLTKDYLLTFRERGNYTAPTESIKMDTCSTVKSSDDEINKEFSFVSTPMFLMGSNQIAIVIYRNSILMGLLSTSMPKITRRKRAG